jgi:uncharacterized protein
MPDKESFPPEVARQLQAYVYRLIDPRNGETFYVGKGRGDRVFAHARAEVEALDEDDLSTKLSRIREITVAGLDGGHVIHRHGMDDATAFEVEAALIEAYPGVTNIVGGHRSSDTGVMHAKEIMRRYAAEPAVFQHRAILISVNRTVSEKELYEATRYAWKISLVRARQVEVILSTFRGLIVGAFVADQWLDATPENFPALEEALPGRIGFVGHEAPQQLKELYVGKRVPDKYRKRGAANPIRYISPPHPGSP